MTKGKENKLRQELLRSCRDPIRTWASLCAYDLNYLICAISHPRE